MGSICIRNTNILQTSSNKYNQSKNDDDNDDVIFQESNISITNSQSSNMMQSNDIFIENNSMNVNDQQWTERKWHDDFIYS